MPFAPLQEKFDDERKQMEHSRKELTTEIEELKRSLRNENNRANGIQVLSLCV